MAVVLQLDPVQVRNSGETDATTKRQAAEKRLTGEGTHTTGLSKIGNGS